MVTLRVRRHDKNFFPSPITTTHLTKGISFFTSSSIGTGWILRPVPMAMSSASHYSYKIQSIR